MTSTPAGLSCGSTCVADFAQGTEVALAATPATGSRFAGWSGDCSTGGAMTMIAARACTATFVPIYALTVTKAGDGGGDSLVTSSPAGISCGGRCTAAYDTGTSVTLSAEAAEGYEFVGWSGAGCSTGTVTLDQARSCTATFAAVPPPGCDEEAHQACRGGGGRWDEETCTCDYEWLDPLVIPLDGHPVRPTSVAGGVLFDVDGDGVLDRVAWTAGAGRMGFLELDRNGNGAIDSLGELFGQTVSGHRRPEGAANSFTLLAAYDTPALGGNGDGRISAADAVFSRLRLWIDTNHDGVSQPNELVPLASAGVTAIELSYRVVGRRDGHGNLYRYRGVVHLSSGRRVPIWDVFLSTGPQAGSDPEDSEDMLPLDDNSASVVMSALAGVAPTPVGADDDAGLASEPALPDPTPTPLQVVQYYHLDAIGSVRAVTDAQGQVIARHDFLPFGEELAPQSPPRDRRLFTGQERDFETALDYFHARQLRVDLGRFTAPDPLTDLAWTDSTLGASNAYGYVWNNPLGFIDPMGAQAQEESKPGGHWKCQYVWKNPCVWIPDVPTFRVTISEVYYPGPDLWLFYDSSDSAGGGGTTYIPGGGGTRQAANNGPKPCGASSSTTSIVSGNATTDIPTIAAGAAIGEAIGGPPGAFLGGIIGSVFGVGGTVSYVPSTKSLYAGPTIVFAPVLGGGNGFSANLVSVPAGQNPNSIANGLSGSVTFQPSPFLGSTVVKSPGSPPVVGPSVGTRIPVSFGASYNFPVIKGGCQ